MVDIVAHPTPVRTRILRTPAAGPDPLNTLVYIDCEVAGAQGRGQYGEWYGVRDQFKTEFKIDGFQQQNYDWYLENTLISATVMLRWFTTTTDLRFSGGLDEIIPSLGQDGTLGFETLWSIYVDDEAWFPESGNSLEMSFRISAYVLCYEPRAETPRGGSQRSYWGRMTDTTVSRRRKSVFAPAADGFAMTLQRPQPPKGSDDVTPRRSTKRPSSPRPEPEPDEPASS